MKFIKFLLIVLPLLNSLAYSQTEQESLSIDSITLESIKNPIQINIQDSIIVGTNLIRLKTSLYCDSNVFLENKAKLVFYKNHPELNFTQLIYRVIFGNIEQTIEFLNNGKIVNKIYPNDIFFKDSISKLIGLTKKDTLDCIFTSIYLLKGEKENLYLIRDWWILSNEIRLIYTMDGRILWWYLVSKPCKPCASSGDEKPILKRYGINKHALEDKYLNKSIQLHHLVK